MIRHLILLLGVAVWTSSLFAHTEPITPLPELPTLPLTVVPHSGTPYTAKSSMRQVLTPEKKAQLEAVLNQELSRLQLEDLKGMSLDSLEDDVSNGSIGQPLQEELEMIGRARFVIDKLKETGNFLLKLTGGDLVTFPVGISQTIGNVTYTMGIGGVKLKPTHAELEVFMEIAVPGKNPILFGSPNIKFTKDGGIVGDACLGLLADFAVDIVKHKSVLKLNKAVVDNTTGSCVSGTYVSIDCDGFKELSCLLYTSDAADE